jgi:ABC-type cobalamin/Fe3+-siderophores transport system ATPase subunit
VAVIGPNGAGKSTLFKTIVGLIPLMQGEVTVHGGRGGNHKDCVSYIPQKEAIDWNYPITVREVVMMGRFGNSLSIKNPEKKISRLSILRFSAWALLTWQTVKFGIVPAVSSSAFFWQDRWLNTAYSIDG